MKNIKLLHLLVLLAAAAGCDKDEKAKDLTPTTVYIVNSGVQEITVYNTGEDYNFKLALYKAGFVESDAKVEVGIFTEDELAAYNTENGTDLDMLPAEYYSVSEMMAVFSASADDVNRSIGIMLHTEEISQLPDNGRGYVIPLKIREASVAVNEEKDFCIIKPDVTDPSIKMTGNLSDDYTFAYPQIGDIDRLITVELDVDNQWDIECGFEIDGDYITAYNDENGTAFELLPAECYSFPAKATIAAPSKSAFITLDVKEDEIVPGKYLLPIRLASVSKFGIVEASSLYVLRLVVNAPLLDRSVWTVTASNEDSSYPISNVLDGNQNTFWHSRWQGGVPPYPHTVIIDMNNTNSIAQIGLSQREDRPMVRGGKISVSVDNTEWTEALDFILENKTGFQNFELANPAAARYLQIDITSHLPGMVDDSSALSEIVAYGY